MNVSSLLRFTIVFGLIAICSSVPFSAISRLIYARSRKCDKLSSTFLGEAIDANMLHVRGGASNEKQIPKKDRIHANSKQKDTEQSHNRSNAKGTKKRISKRIVAEKEEDDEYSQSEDVLIETKPSSSVNTIFSSAIDIFEKTPPITRYFLTTSFFITLLSCLLNKNQWPSLLHFEWTPVLFQFQWWRIVSAFLYFGPLDIFYPLTLQFVWQHMGQLERLSSKSPEDFFVMTLFGGLALILLYPFLGISMKFLGHNLATYYVYIWARTFEGSDVNFMDLFTLKAELMPWFFCLQSFLLEQEIPFADLIGIGVGHIYYYLSNKKILKIPERIREWFRSPLMRNAYRKFYDAMD